MRVLALTGEAEFDETIFEDVRAVAVQEGSLIVVAQGEPTGIRTKTRFAQGAWLRCEEHEAVEAVSAQPQAR